MSADPEPAAARLAAALAARREGRLEAAIAGYRAALAGLDDPAARHEAGLMLTAALCDAGRREEAVVACAAAIGDQPARHSGHAMLASILVEMGQLEPAARAARTALALAPGDIATLNLLTGIALADGRSAAAAEWAAAALAAAPADTRALAHRVVALSQQEPGAELASLLDFDRLLRVVTVEPPPGFATIAAFNAALATAISVSDGLERAHVGKAMVGGARLPDSFTLAPALTAALRALFERETRAWCEALAVADDHPARRGRPASLAATSSWANLMEAAAHELPHIHDGAWLSGVYYVEMPPGTGGDDAAIIFGGHDLGAVLPVAGPTRTVRPAPGMMVLFPSYFYHRTVAFAGGGRRISIAFDVARARG